MGCEAWTELLLNRGQPAPMRLEAARKLARECSDYSAWCTLCSIVIAEDDDVVVRCAVVRALPVWSRYAAINFLANAFANEKVRAAAIETLEEIGPVEDEVESQLLADLAALRGGTAHICIAGGLPGKYGRDPRVLEYCAEVLHAGNETERAVAAATLCCLGEVEVAHLAARDSSPSVRATLCQQLGFYREDRGCDVLEHLLKDADQEVAKQAKKALRLLGRLEKAKPPASTENSRPNSAWGRLLCEISSVRLSDSEVAVDVPDEMVEAGWLGRSGANEEQIEAAERRLGARLPPSYRGFLAESNGFQKLSWFIWKLYGTEEIDWFRVRNADWIEAYQDGDDISPDEHLENRASFRSAYLTSCLQISEEGDSCVVLLNPEVLTGSGEWETWFFANWLPGAERYRSFREYMESELESAIQRSKESITSIR